MRIALLLLLASAVCFTGSSPAQTVNPTYNFVDILSSPQSVKRITLTMQDAFADNTNAIITTQPITRLTDTNGTYTFTNVASGYTYRVQLDTPFGSTIRTNGYPTGLTGNVNARDYLGVKVGQVFAFFYQTNGSASWTALTGKPTTLAGFGITDAASASALTAASNALAAASQPTNTTLTQISGLNTNQIVRPDQIIAATNAFGTAARSNATAFSLAFTNANYTYVDPRGSDTIGIGTSDRPFFSLTNALANGTNIVLRPGTYGPYGTNQLRLLSGQTISGTPGGTIVAMGQYGAANTFPPVSFVVPADNNYISGIFFSNAAPVNNYSAVLGMLLTDAQTSTNCVMENCNLYCDSDVIYFQCTNTFQWQIKNCTLNYALDWLAMTVTNSSSSGISFLNCTVTNSLATTVISPSYGGGMGIIGSKYFFKNCVIQGTNAIHKPGGASTFDTCLFVKSSFSYDNINPVANDPFGLRFINCLFQSDGTNFWNEAQNLTARRVMNGNVFRATGGFAWGSGLTITNAGDFVYGPSNAPITIKSSTGQTLFPNDVTASTFTGSGANLTALPWAALTGVVSNTFNASQFTILGQTNINLANGVPTTNLTDAGTITAAYFKASGSTPTATVNTNTIGAGAGLFFATGANSTRGFLSISNGPSTAASALAVTITFNVAMPSAPNIVGLFNGSASTITGSATPKFFPTNWTVNGFEIWTGPTAPTASTTYSFSYLCIQ